MNLCIYAVLLLAGVCVRALAFDKTLDWLAKPASAYYIRAHLFVCVRADHLSHETEYLQLKTKLKRQNSFSRVLGTKRATSKPKVKRISVNEEILNIKL